LIVSLLGFIILQEVESGARESEEDLAKLVADLQKRMEQTEV